MKAVVVGGSGQIGGWLLRHLADRGHEAVGTSHTVPGPGLVPLDASKFDESARWLRDQRPEVVFYPAGFTWVDGCERDPSLARSANFEAPMNLARAAAASGARFVSFSTDYVFDGANGPYGESASPRPLSVYGRAKLDAEHALADELGDLGLTIRTSWVFGPERQGKNFAYQLIRSLRQGKPVECPSDQRSSPSYGPDVATAAVALAEAGSSGLIHVAGPGVIDRPEFARRIARSFDLDESLIIARTTADLGQVAPRPLSGGLLTPRLDAQFPGLLRPFDDALADFRTRLDHEDGWASP